MLFLILPFFLLSLPLLKGIHPVYNVCDKTLTKMNLGRKGFDLPYVHHKGKSEQELKTGTWGWVENEAEVMGGHCLLGCSPCLAKST